VSCDHDFLKSLHPQGKCPVCPDVPVHKPVVQDIRARAQAAKIELSKRSLYHFLINGWHVLEHPTRGTLAHQDTVRSCAMDVRAMGGTRTSGDAEP